MYFKFHDNLPQSVVRAVFHFYAENDPDGPLTAIPAELPDRGTIVEVPPQATHLAAIRFYSSLHSFFYAYSGPGYALENGGYMPPLETFSPGMSYAGGVVIHTGIGSDTGPIEEDMSPFKGKVIALEEEKASYTEGQAQCRLLRQKQAIDWHLPDILELTDLHRSQESLNAWLLRQGGTPLCDAAYWCRDDSVVELGICFQMQSSRTTITSKTEPHRIRLLFDY